MTNKNTLFINIHNMIENNIDCSILLDELEKKDLSLKEKKSFISLKLRYLVKNNIKHMIENILETHTLMNRDYWLIIEYYYNMKDNSYYIMQKYISSIDTCDIDLMITKNWYDLIEKWDGFPVISSFDSNTINLSMLKKYNYDIKDITNVYKQKIPSDYLELFCNMIKDADVLIDGANISHISKFFNYNILVDLIKILENLNFKPKIILHERHNVNNKFLQKYIVKTPKNNYDDNFLLYGMFQYNKMVVSNDLFRDHVIGINNNIKCYIEMMTIQYVDMKLIIPQYSKCIQVINNNIYIPTKKGFYLLQKN